MAALCGFGLDAGAQSPSSHPSKPHESSSGQDSGRASGSDPHSGSDTSSNPSDQTSDAHELNLPELLVRDLRLPTNIQAFAPRPDHAASDTALKGFVEVPGTKIFFKLGIGATTALAVTSKALSSDTWFTTSAIPVRGQPNFDSPGPQSTATANQSDISLEMRSKTELGPLKVLFNTSFAQAHPSFGFHPNFAYAQLGGALAGFTDSTFADVDAYPKTLDFEGPNALVFSKHAVIRYSHTLGRNQKHRSHLSFALEQPGTNAPSSAGQVRNLLPDGVVAWRAEGGWGHLQLAGLVRAVGIQSQNNDNSQTVLGIGGNLTGAYHLFHKHTLQFGVSGGQGIGAYLNDTGGGQYDAALDRSGALKAIPLLGAYAGLNWSWTHNLTSTATYGWLKLWDDDFDASLGTTGFHRSQYAALNLVAHPIKGLLVGIEGLWGYNRILGGRSGQAVRGQVTFQYRF